jgi:hypothetical protein
MVMEESIYSNLNTISLKPVESPGLAFAKCFMVTVIWNAFFLWLIFLTGFKLHESHWLKICGMSLFFLIGFGFFLATFRNFLALFNPHVELRVNTATLQPGDRLELHWTIQGNTKSIKSLHFHFRGQLEMYGFRTLSVKTIKVAEIMSTSNLEIIQAGSTQFNIPLDTMPTKHIRQDPDHWEQETKILWAICVDGRIPWWANLRQEYRLTVIPKAELFDIR